jgi:hypothetical protein
MKRKTYWNKIFMKRVSALVLAIFLFTLSVVPFGSVQAAGASLSFSPSSSSKSVGDNFSIKVMVNSGGGQGINASDATITFDKDILSIKSVSKDGSIFNMWQTEPAFSNSGGTVNYSGGKTPPAYTGTAGTLMTINFTALKAGEAVVKFSAASVLAADGQGTNILSGTSQAKISISEKVEQPKPETKPETKPANKPVPETKPAEVNTGIIPPPPKVKSATHPEEGLWYSSANPEYEWKLLADVSSVSFLLDTSSSSDPGNKSDGIVELKKFELVPDGKNYFHIKFQNKNGWGPTTHFSTLVDVTPPDDVIISIDNGDDKTNPTPKLIFETADATSGLSKYRFILDGEMKDMPVEEYEKTPYTFPVLRPGLHRISVAATDRAGNTASSTREFVVEALKAPVITEMPGIIDRGDDLPIQGTSFYPDSVIKIYIAKESDKDGKEAKIVETKTDPDGNWTYFQRNELDRGVYRVWAKVIDHRGAESYESMKKTLSIQAKSIVCSHGWWIVFALTMIILLLIGAIMYLRHTNRAQRDRAIRESRELERRLNEIFSALKEEVNELMEVADKKPGFSDSEKRVKDKINEALDISQEFLSKEVKDVEKEIE